MDRVEACDLLVIHKRWENLSIQLAKFLWEGLE